MAFDPGVAWPHPDGVHESLPSWLEPYAERMARRFPEVMEFLGEPQLARSYLLPGQGDGSTCVHFQQQMGGNLLMRVQLERRAEAYEHYEHSKLVHGELWHYNQLHAWPPVSSTLPYQQLFQQPLDPLAAAAAPPMQQVVEHRLVPPLGGRQVLTTPVVPLVVPTPSQNAGVCNVDMPEGLDGNGKADLIFHGYPKSPPAEQGYMPHRLPSKPEPEEEPPWEPASPRSPGRFKPWVHGLGGEATSGRAGRRSSLSSPQSLMSPQSLRSSFSLRSPQDSQQPLSLSVVGSRGPSPLVGCLSPVSAAGCSPPAGFMSPMEGSRSPSMRSVHSSCSRKPSKVHFSADVTTVLEPMPEAELTAAPFASFSLDEEVVTGGYSPSAGSQQGQKSPLVQALEAVQAAIPSATWPLGPRNRAPPPEFGELTIEVPLDNASSRSASIVQTPAGDMGSHYSGSPVTDQDSDMMDGLVVVRQRSITLPDEASMRQLSANSLPDLSLPIQRRDRLECRRSKTLDAGLLEGAVSMATMRASVGSLSPKAGEESLRRRRNLNLTLSKEHYSPTSSPSSSRRHGEGQRNRQGSGTAALKILHAGSFSPENKQPAVQLILNPVGDRQAAEEEEKRKRARKPLPAAFFFRRTLIFFDWDDTLCPTTWIRSVLKGRLADIEEWAPIRSNPESQADWYHEMPRWFNYPLPDVPAYHELMEELQKAVVTLLEVAQAIGVVVIVTNAMPGWVEKTMKKWMPQLIPYVKGHGARPPIRILYGQQVFKRVESLKDLPWVNDLGEYMWWKKAAMSLAIEEIDEILRHEDDTVNPGLGTMGLMSPKASSGVPCLFSRQDSAEEADIANKDKVLSWTSSAQAKRIVNIISVGDNPAEMQAATIAGHQQVVDRRLRRGREPSVERVELDPLGFFPQRFASADFHTSASSSHRGSSALPTLGAQAFTRTKSDGARSDFHNTLNQLTGFRRRKRAPSPTPKEPRRLTGTACSLPPQRGSKDAQSRPWVKLLKFEECCHVKRLAERVHETAAILPEIVNARSDLQVELANLFKAERKRERASPASPGLHSYWYKDLQSPLRPFGGRFCRHSAEDEVLSPLSPPLSPTSPSFAKALGINDVVETELEAVLRCQTV
eukprot:TRINITY_DN90646_c0_g1_i1.p1 TRINITY_DN90646_c0_g1~~TRINITY_DN90646_c0_g1_i1.p1  ORF type:complete len:1124 (+),score=211.74 TRINITY_DN90646_c0_g1_i1:84-3455(+)